jgi:hypothetical protein
MTPQRECLTQNIQQRVFISMIFVVLSSFEEMGAQQEQLCC